MIIKNGDNDITTIIRMIIVILIILVIRTIKLAIGMTAMILMVVEEAVLMRE